jgi:quinol monooxygenase YgiN
MSSFIAGLDSRSDALTEVRLPRAKGLNGATRVRPLRHESGSTTIIMIIATLRILPVPERRAEVLEVFQAIQGPVLAQPGCIACHIYKEHGAKRAVALVERWASQATLEAHLRSETYRRVLGAIELSGSAPEVSFDYVSATEGMDLIERSRRPATRAN